MDYKGSVIKRIALFLMVATLAVVTMACQGAVGKTGGPGPKGDPGDPAPPAPPVNLAPQARALTIDVQDLREGGSAITVEVASNFLDPDGDDAALTLSHSVDPPAGVVTVDRTDGTLTITPVDAGEAVIIVTATDSGGLAASATLPVTVVDAGSPMYIGSLSGETLTFGGQQKITGDQLEDSFDGESLTFEAGTEDTTIVRVDRGEGDDAKAVIITALQTAGTATVTITATDEDGDMASESIEVEVRASLAPVLSDMMPEPMTLYVGGDPTEPMDVAPYFDNHGLEALTYEAESDDDAVAAGISGSMLTMTPTNMRMEMETATATVTITATNMHGMISQTIMVTVMATPPTAEGMIPAQTIAAGDSRSIALDQYFEPGMGSTHDDLTYTESVEGSAATALISGDDTLVITAGTAAGMATITVTATDGEDEYAMQTVMVTVTVETRPDPPEENMAPQRMGDMMLADLRIEIVDSETDIDNTTTPTKTGTDNDTRAADGPGDAADNKFIDLSKYFEDPDGPLLFFKVEKDETPDVAANKPVIDIHSMKATAEIAADGEAPDGTKAGEGMVVIEPRNPGTATVTVTVTDVDGDDYVDTFMVTVVASGTNEPPNDGPDDATSAAAEVVPDLTGVFTVAKDQPADSPLEALRRLTIGETRKVIDGANINTLFSDPDFAKPDRPNEMLTFSVKYFPLDIGADNAAQALAAANPDTKELEDDKRSVTHSLTTSSWNGSSSAKLTLSLTGTQGSPIGAEDGEDDDGHLVALIATDEYGESVAHVLRVLVNHAPKAEGAQANADPKGDPKTLGDEDMYMDIGFDSSVDGGSLTHVVLVAENSGYFHDPDGAADGSDLTCRIKSTTGTSGSDPAFKFALEDATGENADSRGLLIRALKSSGTGSVTIACLDAFMVTSMDATLDVKITHQSRSRH